MSSSPSSPSPTLAQNASASTSPSNSASSRSESISTWKHLELEQLNEICMAEHRHYHNGLQKPALGDRFDENGNRRPRESIHKDAFGPHYVPTADIVPWMRGWELRSEEHKAACAEWVRAGGDIEQIPKPGAAPAQAQAADRVVETVDLTSIGSWDDDQQAPERDWSWARVRRRMSMEGSWGQELAGDRGGEVRAKA